MKNSNFYEIKMDDKTTYYQKNRKNTKQRESLERKQERNTENYLNKK